MKFTTVLLTLLSTLTLTSAQSNATSNNYLGTTPAQRYVINGTQAQSVILAAVESATNISSPSNIAITDPAGLLVAFYRMDNAFPGSIDISQRKARTVSLFNGAFTTMGLYNGSQPGQPLYGIEETNGGLVVFGGGVPLIVDGIFIGAVGVSGGTVEQDITVANAGAQAIGGYVDTSAPTS